jgi:branched-chain amino acid transport system substrate-binding protein
MRINNIIGAAAYKRGTGTYAFDEKGNMKQFPGTVFTFKGGQFTALSSY